MNVKLQHSTTLIIKQLEKLFLNEEKQMKAHKDNKNRDNFRWRFPNNRERQENGYGGAQQGGQSSRDTRQWMSESNRNDGQRKWTRERGNNDGQAQRTNQRHGRWRGRSNRSYFGAGRSRTSDDHDKGNRRGQFRKNTFDRRSRDDKEERVKQLERELREMKQQLERAMNAQAQDDSGSKYSTFILDSGANPLFVHTKSGLPTYPAKTRQVATPNGHFRTKEATMITLRTPRQKIRSEALVFERLPRNLLSLTPIVQYIGAVMFDRTGAALIPDKEYDRLKSHVRYFARLRKGLYEVPNRAGAVCLGAQALDTVEARSANVHKTGTGDQPWATATTKRTTNKTRASGTKKNPLGKGTTNKLLVMTTDRTAQTRKFDLEEHPAAQAERIPKYDCHMILNHASPDVLTLIARNPYVNESSLEGITTTKDITCWACLQGKLARSPHRRKQHTYALGEALSTDIMGPLQLPGIPSAVERYFISMIDTQSRYAYVANLTKRSQTGKLLQDFLARMARTTGQPQRWLVSDNAGEYMAEVIGSALVDLDIIHVPAIPYSSEENGIAERFNRTIMNAVRTAFLAANMSWEYCPWALQDAVDKYNQLTHRGTGRSPHELWFREKKPDLQHLYIFGQIGFCPIMHKTQRANKHNGRGSLVRYLGRDSATRIITEATDGTIIRCRGADVHPYFSTRDPVLAMRPALDHDAFPRRDAMDMRVAEVRQGQADDTPKTAMVAGNKSDKYRQPIPKEITPTTANQITRSNALRYPDRDMWAKSLDRELDKLEEQGTIRWLKPDQLGIIPKNTKVIHLTFTFNYKRRSNGTIEERKSRASLSGDQMIPGVHYDAACTSAPMVDRIAARMIISYSADRGWKLEHLDVKSAFLHEDYGYHKPVYIKEPARADGRYKHGRTVGILIRNLCGNPSGKFYYVQGLLDHLRKMQANLNQAEACLVRVQMPAGSVIAAIAVDDFLVTAETNEAMDQFTQALKVKYDIKRLGRPQRYLARHCHYEEDGSVALSQRLLIDQALTHAGILDANGKMTPYPAKVGYHALDESDHKMPESLDKYRQLVGELRYIADSTRPDIAFAVGRLGYLKRARNYGLYFRKTDHRGKITTTCKTSPLQANDDADWANDKGDRRSVTGGFVTYRGHPIAWVAKKQNAVAMSTAEAEYRAMVEMMQRGVYMQTLAQSFEKRRPPLVVNNDNMPAITMVNALGLTKTSKFIDLRHQYIKQQVRDHNRSIQHVPSKELTADMFTKALYRIRFEKLRRMIKVEEIPQLEQRLLTGH